jgi:hypothetical protein
MFAAGRQLVFAQAKAWANGLAIATFNDVKETKESVLPQLQNSREDRQSTTLPAQPYAPRQYSLRASIWLTAKLVLVAGCLIALLWMLETFVSK